VAYADFVTAMMALFMVLWLYTAPEEIQKAVSRYFRDAKAYDKQSGTAYPGTGEGLTGSQAMKQKVLEAMKRTPDFDKLKANIQVTVTGEGLRVELIEDQEGMFFDIGQPTLTQGAKDLLGGLAHELGRMPNRVVIEGHTDAKQFRPGSIYGNWELSFNRANAARKLMEANGLRTNQVFLVSGFADCLPLDSSHPKDATNRRISVIVSYAHQLS
jgi:chemotaxis protein MotB